MRHVAAAVDEFRIGWRHHHADSGDGRAMDGIRRRADAAVCPDVVAAA
jgi:hypothetical protein